MLLAPPNRSLHTPYHYAAIDRRYGNTIDRPNVVDGRRPRAGPGQRGARSTGRWPKEYDLEVGDAIDWRAFAPSEEDSDDLLGGRASRCTSASSGIGVYPNEVVPTAPYDSLPFIYLTPAFFERHQERAHVYGFYAIRLRNGEADAAGFRKELYATLREFGVDPQTLPLSTRFDRNAEVERAIEPQAIALWIFAALTFAALLLVIIQVLARQILLDSDEYRELQALGHVASPAVRRRDGARRCRRRAGCGARGDRRGARVAAHADRSGATRRAESRVRGQRRRSSALGFVAIVVLVVGLAAIPAWRAANVGAARSRASRRVAHDTRSRLSEAVASAGVPADARDRDPERGAARDRAGPGSRCAARSS